MCMPRGTKNEAQVPFTEAVAGKLRAARARERTFNVIGSSSEYVLLDQLRGAEPGFHRRETDERHHLSKRVTSGREPS